MVWNVRLPGHQETVASLCRMVAFAGVRQEALEREGGLAGWWGTVKIDRTFSSVLSRSFLRNDSTQSLKHFSTRLLYIRRLCSREPVNHHVRPCAQWPQWSQLSATHAAMLRAPVTDLHLLDRILQPPLLFVGQAAQAFERVVHGELRRS